MFDVLDELGRGGMGVVHRVYHREWRVQLAMKTPLPSVVQRAGGAAAFSAEAMRWISLGMHPNVVTAYLVIEHEGALRLLIELIDGGSLARHDRQRPLTVDEVLDVARCTAAGVAHLHARGVVHGDIKPANVLRDRGGTSKITDLGLGYTPEYCAPEQRVDPRAAGPAADLWCWAATVLELLLDDRPWSLGMAAGASLARHAARLSSDPINGAKLGPLCALLARCFELDARRRPDATEIANALAQIAGEPRDWSIAKTAFDTADDLNNRALSMLALGATDEAERYFNRAIAGDPEHGPSVYNRALSRWRSGKCTDAECQRVVASALRDAERTERALQWLREESGERGDDDARWSLRAESYARGPRARSVAVDQPRQRLWIADARGALAVVDLASGAARSIAIGVEPECAIALSDRWVLAAAKHNVYALDRERCELAASVGIEGESAPWLLASSDDAQCVLVVRESGLTLLRAGVAVRFERQEQWPLVASRAWSAAAMSADGSRAALADRSVFICDGRTMDALGSFEAESSVACAALSDDGAELVFACDNGAICSFDLRAPRARFRAEFPGVRCVELFVRGRWILANTREHGALAIDRATGQCVRTLEASTRPFFIACFQDRAERASAGTSSRALCVLASDGDEALRVRLWSPPARRSSAPRWLVRPRSTSEQSEREEQCAEALSRAAQHAEAGRMRDASAQLEHARSLGAPSRYETAKTAQVLRSIARHGEARSITHLFVTATSEPWPAPYLVVDGDGQTIALRSTATDRALLASLDDWNASARTPEHNACFSRAALMNRALVVQRADRTVWIRDDRGSVALLPHNEHEQWDKLLDAEARRRAELARKGKQTLATHGATIAAVSFDGVRLWSAVDRSTIEILPFPVARARSIALDPRRGRVLVGADDGRLAVLARSSAPVESALVASASIEALGVLTSLDLLAVYSSDRVLRLLSLSTLSVIATLTVTMDVEDFAVTDDESTLLLRAPDERIVAVALGWTIA